MKEGKKLSKRNRKERRRSLGSRSKRRIKIRIISYRKELTKKKKEEEIE